MKDNESSQTMTKPRELSSTHIGPRALLSVAKEVEGGSVGEAIGGIGALVLGILGLIGILPSVLGSIAAICAGAAFVIGGGFLAVESAKIFNNGTRTKSSRRGLTGEVGLQILIGFAGMALGVLALLQISTITLIAVSAIILGSALTVTGASLTHLESLVLGSEVHRDQLVKGSDISIGLGAVVLGILALVGVTPLVLVMIAMLGIGAGVLFHGSWFATRVSSTMRG
jgi:hypothetical protein